MRRLAPTVPALRDAFTQLAKALLGWSPRPVADTILDTAGSLLEKGLV